LPDSVVASVARIHPKNLGCAPGVDVGASAERVRGLAAPGRPEPSSPALQSKLERFFGLSLDLLVIAGLDGCMKQVNPAHARTRGYPA
jgi:hypothetical protein